MADGVGASHAVCGVAGTVVSVLTNAISMAGVVGVLLVGVAVAVGVAAVAAVAVVVVRGGGGRLILTNDTACMCLEARGGSIGECLGACGEAVINFISGGCSVGCGEYLDTTAHDGGRARQVDQDVGLDVTGSWTNRVGTAGGRGNHLDSAALRILEWVNATVFVLLTKRSPLVAHVGALSLIGGSSC